jgi:putative PIN family toxin of toxin-antitoxin system
MTNYVFDTNCIISANISQKSIVRQAYNKAQKDGILLYSSETISELTQVFTRPKFDKYLSIEERMSAIAMYENKDFLTEVHIKIGACRDPKTISFWN